jgi:hypothetical protein
MLRGWTAFGFVVTGAACGSDPWANIPPCGVVPSNPQFVTDTAMSSLPPWASGDFASFNGAALYNLRIDAPGRYEVKTSGGDFFGCQTGSVAVSGDGLELRSDTTPAIISGAFRATTEEAFAFIPAGGQLADQCPIVWFVRGSLCGADPQGNYGAPTRAVTCTVDYPTPLSCR